MGRTIFGLPSVSILLLIVVWFNVNVECQSDIVVTSDNCKNGNTVIRGPDWKSGDQDHKNGAPGTGVITKCSSDYWATVEWSNGNSNGYRIGATNLYELFYTEKENRCEDKEQWCAYKPDCIEDAVKAKCPKFCKVCKDDFVEWLFGTWEIKGITISSNNTDLFSGDFGCSRFSNTKVECRLFELEVNGREWPAHWVDKVVGPHVLALSNGTKNVLIEQSPFTQMIGINGIYDKAGRIAFSNHANMFVLTKVDRD